MRPFFAGSVPYINAFYGQGSGPIWLDYLRCTGNETALMNCSHSGIGITRYYCGHDDDVGVQCPGILVAVSLSGGGGHVIGVRCSSTLMCETTPQGGI